MPIRVLCLHGSRQTMEIFQNQLSRLEDDLTGIAELVFLDAPHLLPFLTSEDDCQTRSWCTAGISSDNYDAGDALVRAAMQPDGPGTALACTVMLGFSQGALMIYRYLRHSVDDEAVQEQLRGIVVAGAPDPRRVFGEAAGDLFSPSSPPKPFFAALPALHIVGRKDALVSPSESAAFAEVCSTASRILYHEHAHSIPALKEVRGAVRDVCLTAAMSSVEAEEARAARAEELDMVTAMYDPDCVEERNGEALVQLALLPETSSMIGVSGTVLDEVHVRALGRLRLCLRVPWSYPTTLPVVEVQHGPAWHSVAFERWAADLTAKTTAYMAEEMGPGTAMLIPAFLYAAGIAEESLKLLARVFSEGTSGHGNAEEEKEKEGAAAALSLWAAEDDTTRETFIAAAEARAVMMVLRETQGSLVEEAGDDAEAESAQDSKVGAEAVSMGGTTRGGSCTLTIGLIGKPSAGKSTFFNAVIDPLEESSAARVAAFPFTTIEPNIGAGFAPLFCPCTALTGLTTTSSSSSSTAAVAISGVRENGTAQSVSTTAACTVITPSTSSNGPKPLCATASVSSTLTPATCDASYGHVEALGGCTFRRHPVRVKDVAGLVQGAYQGKGKGNQFLNDLCDADVLVHVVDGAAATEADGTACAIGQGSALEDITWVRSEVHSWIYDNLRAKWLSLIRQPAKFRTMFSGYRSTPSFVDRVLRRLGIANEPVLTTRLRGWGPEELHTFVALYIRLRFPMVVALNKADLPTAGAVAAALQARYPHEHFVPMSARMETLALQLSHRGYLQYTPGSTTVSVTYAGDVTKLEKKVRQELLETTTFFKSLSKQPSAEKPLTTTGVQDVLAAAVEACAVVLVYPVRSFHPVHSLTHCLTFRPGTSAEKVFNGLLHLKLLEGKLVRFEVSDVEAMKQQQIRRYLAAQEGNTRAESAVLMPMCTLRKTEVIHSSAVLARVLSNKRQLT